ncbi:MAG: 3-deoxy-7-phosphoheptulonate synthase [Eubacteriaceae bacterium]|nr:3-deoxy-7-phosphoheptulonate synthase [Eubacteriaceae bacterium]
MIVVIKPRAAENEIQKLMDKIRIQGVDIHYSKGASQVILGLVGDTQAINRNMIASSDIVEKVLSVQEPYKKANRLIHPQDTILEIMGRKVGEGNLTVMAGPCSVESEEQIVSVAKDVQAAGAHFLRGGAFKPRTSPYSFQGMGKMGLELLSIAKKETGLPLVSELMDLQDLDLFEDVDVIQVGARNMQNFSLLKELGKIDKPILLKRGLSATIEEWIMSAEYIMAGGNEEVILCERGIRTFETMTRNTLDLSCIPIIKSKTHLPIIVDPSHATGIRWAVKAMAKAAVAAGADGIMVEVHNDPAHALCDGEQALSPVDFSQLMDSIQKISQIEGKVI